VLSVGQHRVDPRARPADRPDPVQGVLVVAGFAGSDGGDPGIHPDSSAGVLDGQ
jgi:hypothetical protein